MKTVKATIVYPVDVEVDVHDSATSDEIWGAIIKAGDTDRDNAAPVVYRCSELIGKQEQEDKQINTQEEWVQFILQKLQKSKAVLDPIVSALTLLKPKAHPEIILMAYQNLGQAIDYLISSVSPTTEFLIQETYPEVWRDPTVPPKE